MSAAASAFLIGDEELGALTLSTLTGVSMLIDEDVTAAQTVTFTLPSDIYDIATQINAQTTNITASISNGNPAENVYRGRFLRIASDTVGDASTLVVSGAGATALGIAGTAVGHAARALVEDYIADIAEIQGAASYTVFGKHRAAKRERWPRIAWMLAPGNALTFRAPKRKLTREARTVAEVGMQCRVRVWGGDLRRAENMVFDLVDAIHKVMTPVGYEWGQADELGDGPENDGVELTFAATLWLPVQRDEKSLGNIEEFGLDLQAADAAGDNAEGYT